MSIVSFAVALAIILGLGFLAWRYFTEAQDLRKRYSGVVDLEDERKALKTELEADKKEQQQFALDTGQRRLKLNGEYEQALATYKSLQKEIALLEENLEDISFGLYKPHFTFQTSDEYKAGLTRLRELERQLIRAGRAATCPVNWTVGDNKREGQRMLSSPRNCFCGHSMASVRRLSQTSHGITSTRWRSVYGNRSRQLTSSAMC